MVKYKINEEAFLALWRKNMPSRDIAKQLGISDYILRRWMRKNHYESAYMTHREGVRRKWLELYQNKLSDSEISAATNEPVSAIIAWRVKNGFEPHTKQSMLTRLELYKAGADDATIAKTLNEEYKTIARWRLSMERNSKKGNKVTDQNRQIFTRLYNFGLSDDVIAARTGFSRSTIQRWRTDSDLPAQSCA